MITTQHNLHDSVIVNETHVLTLSVGHSSIRRRSQIGLSIHARSHSFYGCAQRETEQGESTSPGIL